MNRVNAILQHKLFVESLKKIADAEAERIFCKHDIEHFAAVARIAYAMCLEEGCEVSKDIVYAAALLHDIGRWRQYLDGTPHEEESNRIASIILPECGYTKSEVDLISYAILEHRMQNGEKADFAGCLYRADKISRLCFVCPAISQCNWEIKITELVC